MDLSLPQHIHRFVQERYTGVLSVLTPEGMPHAATVSYTADSDLHFYMLSRPSSRKATCVMQNPNVCLTIFNDSALAKSVQIRGTALVLREGERYEQNLRRLVDRLWERPQFIPTVYKMPGDSLVMLEVTALEIDWLENNDQISPAALRRMTIAR